MLIGAKTIPNRSQLIRIVSDDYNTTTLYNATETRPNLFTGSKKHHHKGKTICLVQARDRLHSNANFVYFGRIITRMVLRAKRGGPGLSIIYDLVVLRTIFDMNWVWQWKWLYIGCFFKTSYWVFYRAIYVPGYLS